MKTLLIDTSSLLYYSYYQSIKNDRDFFEFFIALLERISLQCKSNEYIFALDSKVYYKKKKYPFYKSNRESKSQKTQILFDKMIKFLHKSRYTIYQKEGYEADDIIATLCTKFYARSLVIISSDKDLYQLLNKDISFYDYQHDIFKYESDIESEFKLKPKQILDLLALKGDKIDNIQGVKGIGKKAAIKLLKEFKTIENIYANIHLIRNTKIKQALLLYKKDAFISKELATLKNNLDLTPLKP